ncbi:MAG: hypothetical protein IJ706_06095 [Clostridia bacterium]|nr:hypothetical protein [Clostridia bacterium]
MLNSIPEHKYDIDVLLLENRGDYIEYLPKWVNIVVAEEYNDIKEEVILIAILYK